jgi:hypothetical protein
MNDLIYVTVGHAEVVLVAAYLVGFFCGVILMAYFGSTKQTGKE